MFPRCSAVHFFAWFVVAVALTGCRRSAKQVPASEGGVRPPQPVRVVVSTPLVAELVRRVGGGGVEVEVLVPVGQPPSSLQRTGPIESRLIAAELVVVLGLGQEAVLAPSLARAAEAGAVVCELASGVSKARLLPRVDDPTQFDPHIWLDPAAWMEATRPIEEALARLRPGWAGEWRDRAHAVRFELEDTIQLTHRLAQASLPPEPRTVRTSQPGVRYLARTAGFAIEVVSDPDELTRQDELETLPLDQLREPGSVAVASVHEHDLGTVEGLRAYALDLLLQRQY